MVVGIPSNVLQQLKEIQLLLGHAMVESGVVRSGRKYPTYEAKNQTLKFTFSDTGLDGSLHMCDEKAVRSVLDVSETLAAVMKKNPSWELLGGCYKSCGSVKL